MSEKENPSNTSNELPSQARVVIVGGGVIGTSVPTISQNWGGRTWCFWSEKNSHQAQLGTRRGWS
mgnify:CR=1 FL=1